MGLREGEEKRKVNPNNECMDGRGKEEESVYVGLRLDVLKKQRGRETQREKGTVAKEKAPINEVPTMPHGNPKSLDSSSHIQRVTLKEPHKSISATRKVHIGHECV